MVLQVDGLDWIGRKSPGGVKYRAPYGANNQDHDYFQRTPGIPGVRSLSLNEAPRPCVDLTDLTLADEDTNSILTDDVKRRIQGNVAMQVTPPGGQICNEGKCRQPAVKFLINEKTSSYEVNSQVYCASGNIHILGLLTLIEAWSNIYFGLASPPKQLR